MSSWEPFHDRIAATTSADELTAIEHELFGRRQGAMTVAMKELGAMDPAARRETAKELNVEKKRLQEAIERKGEELAAPSDAQLKEDGIDITLELPARRRGHFHLIPEFMTEVEDVFGRMGFAVADGPEIETEGYNFSFLNIPTDHPARDAQDTFWLQGQSGKPPDDRLVLRTQTSSIQVRYMQSHEPPLRTICHGKCYRKDADATHSPMFHQVEALMVDREISLANMKFVMIQALQELIGHDTEFRFRTGYFPFVEPGLEVDARWKGDAAESREGAWLEIAGCGMVHPTVLRNGGIDPDQWQGFAFAFGLDRMLMIRHQIPDMRAFFQGDPRFLRQFG